MKLTLTLVLVTMAACASILCGTSADPLPQPEAPPAETRSRFAALDDVRLLATGLLQLGQSLREFVHKTKGQINDIFQKLQNFDFYFNQLSNMASEIKEEEEELKKTTVVLKANNDELKNQSLEISSKVDYILQERQQLQSAVGGLEQRVRSLSLDMVSSQQLEEITALRELSHTQEQSIVDLLRAVKEQSEQLNHQRMKINILEEKLATNTLAQETVETMTDISVSETPTLPPFLSTNGSQTNVSLPSDCSDLFDRGERVSGVYAIRPEGHPAFMAYCDMTQDGGSTVIQRRKDGSVNFDQTWERYENGFGEFQGEFWLGLKKIYSLASNGDRHLHIQLEDWKQGTRSIEYSFSLEGPDSSYTLHLAQASGDLPDAMINHTGMMFSTKDRDNDNHQDSNCALDYTGGWWFNACGDTNLNGRYTHLRPKGRSERRRGIQWRPSRRTAYSLRHTQMSIGPASARRPAVSTTPASTELNFI